MKLDTEIIHTELVKLDGIFVYSLQKGFTKLSDIQSNIQNNGYLIDKKHEEIKEKETQTLNILNEKVSSVKYSLDKIEDADLDFLEQYKNFAQEK